LLYWLLRRVQADAALELQLVVTGMHLSQKYGMTVQQIVADGFSADAMVDLKLDGDTPKDITSAMGRALIGFAGTFEKLQPDIVVVLGDRFEIFAAAQAAMMARIPIAHIHGGELTEGALDDAMRHSITKMAHLHFVASEAYRRRVMQLGEAPDRIWTVGAPGVDAIHKLKLLDRTELAEKLAFDLHGPYFLMTYHPVTLLEDQHDEGLEALCSALDDFPDHRLLVTGVNADPGHDRIRERLDAFAAERSGRVFLRTSLGQLHYLSAMAHADAVVGNSSSGLIEAPALGVPTVNVGARQRGRARGVSIIDVDSDREQIAAAIRRAITAEFRAAAKVARRLSGDGSASDRIVDVLRDMVLDGILMKRFQDCT